MHARACAAVGLPDLGRSLTLLSADTTTDVADLLSLIAPHFTDAFFPRSATLTHNEALFLLPVPSCGESNISKSMIPPTIPSRADSIA